MPLMSNMIHYDRTWSLLGRPRPPPSKLMSPVPKYGYPILKMRLLRIIEPQSMPFQLDRDFIGIKNDWSWHHTRSYSCGFQWFLDDEITQKVCPEITDQRTNFDFFVVPPPLCKSIGVQSKSSSSFSILSLGCEDSPKGMPPLERMTVLKCLHGQLPPHFIFAWRTHFLSQFVQFHFDRLWNCLEIMEITSAIRAAVHGGNFYTGAIVKAMAHLSNSKLFALILNATPHTVVDNILQLFHIGY